MPWRLPNGRHSTTSIQAEFFYKKFSSNVCYESSTNWYVLYCTWRRSVYYYTQCIHVTLFQCQIDQLVYGYHFTKLLPTQSFVLTLTLQSNAFSTSYTFSVRQLYFILLLISSSFKGNQICLGQRARKYIRKRWVATFVSKRPKRWWVSKISVVDIMSVALAVEGACVRWVRLP